MTSLSNQLEVLRTATARHLTIEKRHISLIFDKKDAGKLDNATAFRIGVAGLEQMKRIDSVFDTEEPNILFDEERTNFVRSIITKEENEALDKQIEELLFKLSPYLQHFACQQVLEFLVHTYHIYAYNAETLIVTFLPFHDTKIYARLLSILDFDFSRSKEWAFMESYKKKEEKIPFSQIVKATMSGTHSIVTRLSDHIRKGVELVGGDFLEKKSPVLFNFYAKLLVSLFNDPQKVDEALLSKLLPFIENGIKSDMVSFRYAAFMVVCQLSLTVKLKKEVVAAITKLLIMKMRANTVPSSLSTLAVVCQQQNVETLSRKAVQKLLRKDDLNVWQSIQELATRTDVTKLLKPLWDQLISFAKDESVDAESTEAYSALLQTSDPNLLTKTQAEAFLQLLISEMSNGFVLQDRKLVAQVKTVCVRFAEQLDIVHDEWCSRDAKVAAEFVETYELKDLIIFKAQENAKKKRTRRRSNSMRKSIGGDNEDADNKKAKKSASEKAEAMAASSEFAKRKAFSGDPLKKAKDWIEEEEWSKVTWALQEMASRSSYFKSKPEDDIEEFVVDLVSISLKKPLGLDLSAVRAALSSTSLNHTVVTDLLSRHDSTSEKAPKKTKGPRGVAAVNLVAKTFSDETTTAFNARLVFVLELLNMSESWPAHTSIFNTLFDIIKQVNASAENEQLFYEQQLAVTAIIKLLDNPGKYKVNGQDLDLECVVETMRNTHSHHLLRDCLRLLTSAVRHAPAEVVKHIMSVFTFMGNGLLRKDNEMTLSIVEKTVESLFQAIITTTSGNNKSTRLIEVARLFAASASDIPAHRRARIAHAISKAVGADNAATITMVLLAGFCARWQRTSDAVAAEAARRGTDQEAYDDLAVELLGALDPFEQLSSVLDMIEYVLRLGGDQVLSEKEKQTPIDSAVFDRSAQTLPRIRHFRYVIVSLIARVFSNRSLIEKLAVYNDQELLERALPMSKRLMECSVELDEFASEQADRVSKDSADAATQRYWVAFASRAEVVSEKLRHLLPGGVAARLIADVLSDSKAPFKMCEKALQLANIKLGHDGFFYTDSGINERELIALAKALNTFVAPETKNADKMHLCQNAAYTLKLIAKHLPLQSDSTVLAATMQKCVDTASQYQKLDDNLTGNVLLLAGELIRSHNMRSTMQHSISLLKICLSILGECIAKYTNAQKAAAQEAAKVAEENRTARNRGQRIRQQSLGGLRLGTDTLLICSLTCVQRIFDKYATFVCEYVGDVVVRYCRLTGRFGDAESVAAANSNVAVPYASGSQTSGFFNKSSVQHRLSLIRRALLTVELRVLPTHFSKAVEELKNEQKALSALFTLFTGYFEPSNRIAVVQLRSKFVDEVFIPALDFRSRQRKPELFENTDKLERNVFDALIAMAGILSEVEFRPVVNAIVAWAEPALHPSAAQPTRLRLVPLLNFAHCFYDAFNALALPYFGRILEITVKALRGCNVTLIGDSSQLLLSGKRGSIEALEVNLLLTLAIDVIASAARHKEFFTTDRCEMVVDALINELVNTKVEGHEERCTKHLVSALYRVGDADPDSFADLLNKILLKTRDNRPKIRYRTLLVIELLLEKIGDGIAPHLTLLVPFLNELIEDENRQVEDQCQQVVNVLQHKFGEQFWNNSSA